MGKIHQYTIYLITMDAEAANTRVARSAIAQEISTNFDKVTGVPVASNVHSTLNDIKDVNSN